MSIIARVAAAALGVPAAPLPTGDDGESERLTRVIVSARETVDEMLLQTGPGLGRLRDDLLDLRLILDQGAPRA